MSAARVLRVLACPSLVLSTLSIIACGPSSEAERQATTSSRISGSDIGTMKITHYTLARESDFASEADFLCSGRGVAMQGTGIRNDGTYVKYVSGGGGWCGGYARLCNCGSATFSTVDSVFGASGRALIKNYSIAVDPNRIKLGSYVWLSALGHWFRADDTGGAIIGMHIDVYTEGPASLPSSSRAFVTSEPHAAGDPGPNGEASNGGGGGGDNGGGGGGGEPDKPPPDQTTERPTGGAFAALDIRYPVGAGGWVTQCNESADGERVWMTMSSGKNASSRWAEAKYPQHPTQSCGDPVEGVYPIVLRSEPGATLGATWITQCAPDAGVARVFQVAGDLDGHPMAPFHHNENDPSCASEGQ